MHGALEQVGGGWQLRFRRRLHHSPEKVWLALTEPEHLRAWFPTDIQGKRAPGAPLRFRSHDGEGPAIDGKMIVFDPPSVLEFRWGDNETLRFELEQDAEGCLLTFVTTFDELGKAARDAAGWHACLDVLTYHLSGEPAPWTPEQRWRQVHGSYVERLGPDAATIGPPASLDHAG